ncbi:hypothetical protein GCM10025865_10920 [Paraoerskovia sediminicola]|uniref:Ketoreductase domain-containing protein n=1 Tax=Paraoerskovia sediminicola TaxID=1138587 RepID=A0ABN6XCF7_9CELL|nr:SDR family oxidoreductase [Paraoerskovia sediminicola]BDZ41793.1 hypothetical protein GCM10025865_10920 [Paraoerskovia sediminicola]
MSNDTVTPKTTPPRSIDGSSVLVVGTGGIGAAVARAAARGGATVTLASRDLPRAQRLAEQIASDVDAAADDRGGAEERAEIRAEVVDLADEGSVAALASRVGRVDHVISTAASPANGPIADLTREALLGAFDAKVVGPVLLAKHVEITSSLTVFSGVVAWRPAAERVAMATANGAASFLAQALAVELAPVRVNAVSPGVVDSGAWDRLGDAKAGFLTEVANANPTRTVGHPDDLAQAALYLATNPYTTGTTLHVDGGARLA